MDAILARRVGSTISLRFLMMQLERQQERHTVLYYTMIGG